MKTRGLSFKKFDFHIHTPASKCFHDSNITADKIINKALECELCGIAITDHNSGVWIDQIKEAAKDKNVIVFPGVEITVGDARNHIVAILDIDKTTRDIEDLLTTIGILHRDFGKNSKISRKYIRHIFKHEKKSVSISRKSQMANCRL